MAILLILDILLIVHGLFQIDCCLPLKIEEVGIPDFLTKLNSGFQDFSNKNLYFYFLTKLDSGFPDLFKQKSLYLGEKCTKKPDIFNQNVSSVWIYKNELMKTQVYIVPNISCLKHWHGGGMSIWNSLILYNLYKDLDSFPVIRWLSHAHF